MLRDKEVLKKNLLASKYCDKRGTAGKRSGICGRELLRFGEEEVTKERIQRKQGKEAAEGPSES